MFCRGPAGGGASHIERRHQQPGVLEKVLIHSRANGGTRKLFPPPFRNSILFTVSIPPFYVIFFVAVVALLRSSRLFRTSYTEFVDPHLSFDTLRTGTVSDTAQPNVVHREPSRERTSPSVCQVCGCTLHATVPRWQWLQSLLFTFRIHFCGFVTMLLVFCLKISLVASDLNG